MLSTPSKSGGSHFLLFDFEKQVFLIELILVLQTGQGRFISRHKCHRPKAAAKVLLFSELTKYF